MLHDLDVGPNDVVSYLLPNLPQTHYTLWGAEAAGIANPINPMLEPKAIVDICSTVKTKVLVTLGTPRAPTSGKSQSSPQGVAGLGTCDLCIRPPQQ